MSTSTFDSGIQVRYNPLGHFTVSVGAGITSLPDPGVSLERVRRIVIQPLDGDVVYRDDGSNPVGGVGGAGVVLVSGTVIIYDGQFTENFKMTRGGAANVDVRIAFYGN